MQKEFPGSDASLELPNTALCLLALLDQYNAKNVKTLDCIAKLNKDHALVLQPVVAILDNDIGGRDDFHVWILEG